MLDIRDELSKNFIDFAAEANSQRAFPSASDGLKPGQRACLWEMYTKGYTSGKPHVKSAKVSGGVAASWWPHGTTAIYDTFARMSMPWINNIPEVDFHGSNGNQVLGASPAADRYTEVRLSGASETGFLATMKKKPVPMQMNFSEDEEWPQVFPAIFPRLLVNGSQGIGVTIAQTWLPMNLNEVANVIKKYVTEGIIDTTAPLIDFPTGGQIINMNDLHIIHETGKGKAILRGTAAIKGKSILITEFPYQVYIEPFIDDVKKLIADGTLTGIDDILNKSDKKRLLVEIICTENSENVLKMLYAKTDLQKNFNANQFALVGQTPKMLTLRDYLEIYVNHNVNCIKHEYEFDWQKAKDKLEITEGLVAALAHIDDIIAIIKGSNSSKEAEKKLIEKYQFTDRQAHAIVEMKLGKLAKLEAVELNDQIKGLRNEIDKLNLVLDNEDEQKKILLTRLDAFVQKFGFARRTQLLQLDIPKETKSKPELVVEPCTVVVSKGHYVQRMDKKSRAESLFTASTDTSDTLVVFTSTGKMYGFPVKDIPVAVAGKGASVSTILKLGNEIPVAYFVKSKMNSDLLFVSAQGMIKSVKPEEFTSFRKAGVIGSKVREGDTLVAAKEYHGEAVKLTSKNGKTFTITSTGIPVQKKNTLGRKSISLTDTDTVAKVDLVKA